MDLALHLLQKIVAGGTDLADSVPDHLASEIMTGNVNCRLSGAALRQAQKLLIDSNLPTKDIGLG